MNTKEKVYIENKQGTARGQFNVYNYDPKFYLVDIEDDKGTLNPSSTDILGSRGDCLILNPDSKEEDRREILAVTFDNVTGIIFVAPKQVTARDPEAKYQTFNK